MNLLTLPYRHIVAVDFEFEFGGRNGNRPRPVCMVARELRTGQFWRLWRGEFRPAPPFPINKNTLVVAYYASAEWGCFRVLGWPAPSRILDLYCEFRDHTNGLPLPAGRGLIGALVYFGINTIGAEVKDTMRDLIISGEPWSADDRRTILSYCESDVLALERLLPAMLPHIDLPRALLRGRYTAAVACVEHAGTPLDVRALDLLQTHWDDIRDSLIAAVNADYDVYDGRTFKMDRFERFLVQQHISWPRLGSGTLDLTRDMFRQMAKSYPIVAPLHELRHSLSEMRLNELAVGEDGRNRCLMSMFASKTGRNQPSNARYIFGPSAWLRSLIKPAPGYALAYIDWSAQEIGIAAALSGDERMMEAVRSGDPYLAFGKQCGKLPSEATKASHPNMRQLLKACVLGVNYGMEAPTLAFRIGQPEIVARELLRAHRDTYRTFWKWSDANVAYAMFYNSLHTVFGWHVQVGEDANPRSLQNFPMQANGAEMLRIACCLATERGIEVVSLVHDAIMICAPIERIEADVAAAQAAMAEASRLVLGGFELKTDANIVRYPDRYMDPRGVVMWERVTGLLAQFVKAERVA